MPDRASLRHQCLEQQQQQQQPQRPQSSLYTADLRPPHHLRGEAAAAAAVHLQQRPRSSGCARPSLPARGSMPSSAAAAGIAGAGSASTIASDMGSAHYPESSASARYGGGGGLDVSAPSLRWKPASSTFTYTPPSPPAMMNVHAAHIHHNHQPQQHAQPHQGQRFAVTGTGGVTTTTTTTAAMTRPSTTISAITTGGLPLAPPSLLPNQYSIHINIHYSPQQQQQQQQPPALSPPPPPSSEEAPPALWQGGVGPETLLVKDSQQQQQQQLPLTEAVNIAERNDAYESRIESFLRGVDANMSAGISASGEGAAGGGSSSSCYDDDNKDTNLLRLHHHHALPNTYDDDGNEGSADTATEEGTTITNNTTATTPSHCNSRSVISSLSYQQQQQQQHHSTLPEWCSLPSPMYMHHHCQHLSSTPNLSSVSRGGSHNCSASHHYHQQQQQQHNHQNHGNTPAAAAGMIGDVYSAPHRWGHGRGGGGSGWDTSYEPTPGVYVHQEEDQYKHDNGVGGGGGCDEVAGKCLKHSSFSCVSGASDINTAVSVSRSGAGITATTESSHFSMPYSAFHQQPQQPPQQQQRQHGLPFPFYPTQQQQQLLGYSPTTTEVLLMPLYPARGTAEDAAVADEVGEMRREVGEGGGEGSYGAAYNLREQFLIPVSSVGSHAFSPSCCEQVPSEGEIERDCMGLGKQVSFCHAAEGNNGEGKERDVQRDHQQQKQQVAQGVADVVEGDYNGDFYNHGAFLSHYVLGLANEEEKEYGDGELREEGKEVSMELTARSLSYVSSVPLIPRAAPIVDAPCTDSGPRAAALISGKTPTPPPHTATTVAASAASAVSPSLLAEGRWSTPPVVTSPRARTLPPSSSRFSEVAGGWVAQVDESLQEQQQQTLATSQYHGFPPLSSSSSGSPPVVSIAGTHAGSPLFFQFHIPSASAHAVTTAAAAAAAVSCASTNISTTPLTTVTTTPVVVSPTSSSRRRPSTAHARAWLRLERAVQTKQQPAACLDDDLLSPLQQQQQARRKSTSSVSVSPVPPRGTAAEKPRVTSQLHHSRVESLSPAASSARVSNARTPPRTELSTSAGQERSSSSSCSLPPRPESMQLSVGSGISPLRQQQPCQEGRTLLLPYVVYPGRPQQTMRYQQQQQQPSHLCGGESQGADSLVMQLGSQLSNTPPQGRSRTQTPQKQQPSSQSPPSPLLFPQQLKQFRLNVYAPTAASRAAKQRHLRNIAAVAAAIQMTRGGSNHSGALVDEKNPVVRGEKEMKHKVRARESD